MENLLNYFTVQRILRLLYLVILVIVFISTVNSVNAKSQTSASYEPTMSPHLNLINTEVISSSLTDKDYLAFQDRLRDFVTKNNQSPVSDVEITNVVVPVREGSATTITVNIPSLNVKNLVVIVDYANGPNGSFSIPVAGYSVPLYGQTYNN